MELEVSMSKKIYLSPSTQERNIGAGSYGSEEKRCNQIADVVEYVLEEHGVLVYRNKPTMTLTQVVADSNSKNADVHFAIHTNALNQKVRGCEVFCHRKGGEGEKLAKAVYELVSSITPTGDRGIKEGYNFYNGKPMYEPFYTKMPAALIEIAFHDNPEDAKWIIENIEKIGIAIAKGILNYFGIKYIVPNTASNENIFYRVVVGSYADKDNAEKRVEELKKAGFDSFIVVCL
jgi:N-acetylmuramoyl-L-alanine amidase